MCKAWFQLRTVPIDLGQCHSLQFDFHMLSHQFDSFQVAECIVSTAWLKLWYLKSQPKLLWLTDLQWEPISLGIKLVKDSKVLRSLQSSPIWSIRHNVVGNELATPHRFKLLSAFGWNGWTPTSRNPKSLKGHLQVCQCLILICPNCECFFHQGAVSFWSSLSGHTPKRPIAPVKKCRLMQHAVQPSKPQGTCWGTKRPGKTPGKCQNPGAAKSEQVDEISLIASVSGLNRLEDSKSRPRGKGEVGRDKWAKGKTARTEN